MEHAFKLAVEEWLWLEASPMARVRKPKEPRGRVRFLSDDECPRLLDACRASGNRMLYPLVMLALATGARKMELLSLTWPQVDIEQTCSWEPLRLWCAKKVGFFQKISS